MYNNYQQQKERVTYNNSVAVMARVVSINPLPDSQYNGQVQKRMEITVQIDSNELNKQQRLTMFLSGQLAELPIKLDDVRIWSFNFKGKEHNGRNYNNLYCWRVNGMDGGVAYPTVGSSEIHPAHRQHIFQPSTNRVTQSVANDDDYNF